MLFDVVTGLLNEPPLGLHELSVGLTWQGALHALSKFV